MTKEQWDSTGTSYIGPGISDQDKSSVRQIIVGGLADPSNKIRTAFAVVISGIARSDFPEKWPDLVPGLIGLVKVRVVYVHNIYVHVHTFI